MKKPTTLYILTLLVSLSAGAAAAHAPNRHFRTAGLVPVSHLQAPPQAAKQPQWKSREEYDAFNAMATEKDPNKKISLAEAFLQKFPTSDFKSGAYLTEMQAYAQLSKTDQATEAARKTLEADPDNLDALAFLSYVFPFTFKADDPEGTSKLSRADSDAHHGLELLQKAQKPAGVSDEAFSQAVKAKRAVFNNAVGFAALQRKDYANAITAFKAAGEDNPSDVYTFYRLGLAYLYSSPPDYDHSLWYIARAVSLARAAKNPAADEINNFLKKAYINYHGNDQGLSDVLTQAAGAVNPPEGFKVAPMEVPKPTGNASVDAFNQTFFQLKLGGDRAQKVWDSLKGQAFGAGGYVDSIEKGTDPGTYLVRIDILDQSKAAEGVYDVELKDSTQPNVKNLSKGDPVHFQGTIASYAATPNLVVTLDPAKINEDEIPEHPKAEAKPKPSTTHRPATRRKTSQ